MSNTLPGVPDFLARLFKRGRGARDFGEVAAGQPAAVPPATATAAMMGELAARAQRAAESILESEGLTGDLDDTAAGALLEWGVACAKNVAHATSGLAQAEAETAMGERLHAVRRMMRLVNQWASGQSGADESLLEQIVEQAAVVYGQAFIPPQAERRAALLQQMPGLAGDPSRLIANLRGLVEDAGVNS
jgi:hypothetical protein